MRNLKMSKEFWDQNFSDKEFVYGKQANQFIQQKSHLLSKNSTIGCFAEGEGRNAIYLAGLGHEVIAYDQSTVGLEKAKQLAVEQGVNVQAIPMDLTKEKVISRQFDAAIMVFGHVPAEDQHFFIHNIIAAVKPGGYVMFEVYSEDQLDYQTGGPREKEMLYHPSDVLQWIMPHHCLHFYYGEVDRKEGKKHTGLSHVIQTVIKKKD